MKQTVRRYDFGISLSIPGASVELTFACPHIPALIDFSPEQNAKRKPAPMVHYIAPPAARGVYEEEVAPPGEHWYKIVLSNGKVGLVHFPDELVDTGLVDSLRHRLDAKDPVQTKLKAI